MADAEYFWKATMYQGEPMLLIFDRDAGKSVTNDIVAVLAEIKPKLLKPLHEFTIVYKDTTGTWDLIVVNNRDVFEGFEPGDPRVNYNGIYFNGQGTDVTLGTHEAGHASTWFLFGFLAIVLIALAIDAASGAESDPPDQAAINRAYPVVGWKTGDDGNAQCFLVTEANVVDLMVDPNVSFQTHDLVPKDCTGQCHPEPGDGQT